MEFWSLRRRPCSAPTLEIKPKRVAKTPAERQREYRARLKSNPELYKAHRAFESARLKEYRLLRSEEKIARDREKCRIRMQRFRDRQKDSAISVSSSQKKAKTRGEVNKQREKWRIQKRKQREAMSQQAKRRHNEKRRARNAEKRMLQKQRTKNTPNSKPASTHTDSPGISSTHADTHVWPSIHTNGSAWPPSHSESPVQLSIHHGSPEISPAHSDSPEQSSSSIIHSDSPEDAHSDSPEISSAHSNSPVQPSIHHGSPVQSSTHSDSLVTLSTHTVSPEKASDNPESSKPASDFRTPAARRMAISRSRRALPKSPCKFATVISSIIKKSSPRKRAALSKMLILSPEKKKRLDFLEKSSTKLLLNNIRERRSANYLKARRVLFEAIKVKNKMKKREARKHLGLSWRFLNKTDSQHSVEYRKKRSDALAANVITKVVSFYERGDISREMPNPRSVSNGVPQRVMECSIQNAYQDFIKEYPNLKLSVAKFSKLKPSHIKTQSHAKFLQCQCEYCVNVQFKLDALSVRCAQLGFQITVPNKYSASAMTTCPNDDTFAKISCVHRECEVCGTHLLLEHFKPLLEDHSEKQIKWKKWTAERYTKPSSNTEDQQESRHMVLRVKNGTISEIVNELLAEMEPFTKHLFNAKWQAKEFANICTVVPEKWLVLCSDFGENYNCHFQDEAQSAHWSYQQATIHPIVAYYRCQESECDKTVRESCMFVSSDTKHDYHAVQHFLVLAVEYLRSKGIEIEHQVHFSDGSPTQYKSKVPFCDASHGSTDFGCTVEKHFFGSRHGKGPCDGEIGVLKKRAVTAVKSRQVIIANAEDLYEYGKDHLSLPKEENSHDHKRRKFFFVGADVIDRSRKERTDVKAIPGTRSLHCFKGIQPYVVATRERSCFCQQCVSESAENECLFQEYAGSWTVSSLKPCRVMRQELATIRRNLNRRSGSSDCGPTGEGSGLTKDSGSTSTQLPPSPACPTEANTESENGTTSDVCNVTTGTALASFQSDRPTSIPVPVEPSEASTPVPVESSEASTPVPVEPSEASTPEINSQDDTSVECGNSKSGDDVTTGRVLVSSPEQTCTTNQNEHNVNSGEPTLPMEKLEQVIQLFQFYAVYYSKTYYIGKPTAIQDGLFVFTFLHKMGATEFVWPNREDTDNISRDRIFGGPIPLIGQGLKFQIQRQTLNELQC